PWSAPLYLLCCGLLVASPEGDRWCSPCCASRHSLGLRWVGGQRPLTRWPGKSLALWRCRYCVGRGHRLAPGWLCPELLLPSPSASAFSLLRRRFRFFPCSPRWRCSSRPSSTHGVRTTRRGGCEFSPLHLGGWSPQRGLCFMSRLPNLS